MGTRRSGFGSIRRLPSGRWQARFIDKSGRVRSTGTTHATKSAAAAELEQVATDLRRGMWIDPRGGRITFEAYSNPKWLDERRVKGRALAPRTRALYEWQLAKHILPALGDIELKDLDAATIRAWHAQLTSADGPGASTAAKCYRLLRAICNTAVADGLLVRSPCSIPGAGQEPETTRPAITVAEVYALIDAVEERWRAAILLAGFCGLRIGELSALRRRDLDLLHGTVTITASASEAAGVGRVVGDAKSAAGRRTVVLPPHIVAEVSRLVETYAQPGPDGLIFVGPKGGPLRTSNFGARVWRPAVNSLGRGRLHFHDLRGTAATLAAIAGATTAELLARMGHTRVDVALRYQRATADRDAALAAALSAYVQPAVLPLTSITRTSPPTQQDSVNPEGSSTVSA